MHNGQCFASVTYNKAALFVENFKLGQTYNIFDVETRLTSLYNQNYCHTLILLAKKQILFFVNGLRHSTI